MVVIIRILEGLFFLGVLGTCITIPLAAWGYFSVLFEKKLDQEEGDEVLE